MRALVVDDEGPARRRLTRMLQQFTDVEVVDQLEDGSFVLEAVTRHAPDVVFLDVHMPGLDGLSLAQRAAELPPIVFVTAHDRYAVEAFAVDAADYLLKPVRPERLIAAVERVRARVERRTTASPATPLPAVRIAVNTRGESRWFDAREITRFWSSEKYTLFRAAGAEQICEEPLAALEQRLHGYGFLRVHRAELVRTDAVQALCSAEPGHTLLLHDGQVVRVSRRALSTIKQALGLS